MANMGSKLVVVPMTLADANAFVVAHHRHSKKVQGHKFSLGCLVENSLVAVAIVGRPVARKLDDGVTCEVTRLCSIDQSGSNVCSFLYRRCWQVWSAMGGHRLITYILESEKGTSLRAAGFKQVGVSPAWKEGKGWTTRSNRVWQPVHTEGKTRWELTKLSGSETT